MSLDRLVELARSATTPVWLVLAIDAYLAGRCETLDEALGVSRAVRTARRRAARNQHVLAAWQLIKPPRPATAWRSDWDRALALEAAFTRARCSRLRSDTELERSIRAALDASLAVPKARQILRIVSSCHDRGGNDMTSSSASGPHP